MENGHFIVFEGGEGSGKSRHSSAVTQRLRDAGHEVIHTHEPGGSTVCEMIRNVLLADSEEAVVPRAELLLFVADRAQHVESVIKPALEAGKIVICDRFSGSTFAYQIGGRQLPESDLIIAMDAYARNGVDPDLVLFLDIDPEIGLRRRQDDDKELNRLDLEELAFHQRVRDYFLQLADTNEQWVVQSTDGPKEANENILYSIVTDRLGL